jgi:serine/threonine protein kinase
MTTVTTGAQNLLFGRYSVEHKVGQGSFGKIYCGEDKLTGDRVAIKFEVKKESGKERVRQEYKIYRSIESLVPWWPKVRQLGKSKNGCHILVMDRLGESLDSLTRPVEPERVLHVGSACVALLATFHEAGFVHRDVKPQNILFKSPSPVSWDQPPALCLIDYGLSTRLSKKAQPGMARSFMGTAKFTSQNTHLGAEQGARDDLQSLGYVLMHLSGVSLPWAGNWKSRGKAAAHHDIMVKKLSMDVPTALRGLPAALRDALTEYTLVVHSLGFGESPDYASLTRIFRKAQTKSNGESAEKASHMPVSDKRSRPPVPET